MGATALLLLETKGSLEANLGNTVSPLPMKKTVERIAFWALLAVGTLKLATPIFSL